MKKIIGCVLTIAVMLGVLFAFSSCDKKGKLLDYSELGMNFRLPEEFRKFTVGTADIHYSTPDVTFEIQYMPKEEFEDIEMGYYFPFEMTVKEYTEFLIDENGWADPEKTEQYTYDEARNSTSFYLFWTPDPNEFPWSYYYFTVMKNEYAFYVAMFMCEEEKYPDYSEKFVEWSSYISLATPAA